MYVNNEIIKKKKVELNKTVLRLTWNENCIENLRWCLDPLLKTVISDFYAQNAFLRKVEVLGWDFGKCKIHSRQNAFCKF